MKRLIFAFCVFVLLLASCAKKSGESGEKDNGNAEYIENYIMQLKDIEKITTEKFNKIMSLLEYVNENQSESDTIYIQLRDAINESVAANRRAVEEFRSLAGKEKPAFVDDTIQILLRTATAILAQSYEKRTDAQLWLNRYVSLGNIRFFEQYTAGMEEAMNASRQAFFFLTTARVRQKVITGDTLDMTLNEFLKIPEIPVTDIEDTAAVGVGDSLEDTKE